ncbi:oligosaccharyl transferase, archaeosortase A system-associated [Chloroflexota bacterium]
MDQSRFPAKLITGVILALFFGIALYLRIYLPYDHVFGGDWIKFTTVDAYYHMRLVDNLIQNYPHFLAFDPYTFYPHGAPVGWPPFFDWLLSSIILIVSLGSPSQHLVDVVGAYFPTVLGAITVIPVYFIGKELFNRWAGVVSAGLITLLPGEFLGRSTLGYTDHHVSETLFTTIVFLFLILAIKAAKSRQLTLDHIKRREWAAINTTLIYSLLTGIFLGIYLLSWVGGLLFVLIITVYFVIQFTIDHLRNRTADYMGIVGTISLLMALVISLPLMPQTWFRTQFLPSMLIAIMVPIVLTGISRLMESKRIRPVYYPLTLVGLGLAGLVSFYIVSPNLFSSMIRMFNFFTPSSASLTITEVRPLLFPMGGFSLAAVWGNFTTASFLSLFSIGILIYLVVKRENAEKNLLLVWSLLVLAATLGQGRFAYYLAVNVALLTGYLSVLLYYVVRVSIDYLMTENTDYISWQTLELANFDKLITGSAELPTRAQRKGARKRQGTRLRTIIRRISISLWLILIIFLVFYPNIKSAIHYEKNRLLTYSDAWYNSLLWLKENSQDPLGNPDAYYELYESPPPGENYNYPESAYGVMAWWGYGHLITRISHRIPVSNPFQQGARSAANFFTAPDETTANQMMDDLGVKYVIIDHETALTTKIFPAVAIWAGKDITEFSNVFYMPETVTVKPLLLYYPEYYRSLSTRLYSFDGKAVTPESTVVISYQENKDKNGNTYKTITDSEQFDTYEEAETYLSSQKSGNYRIVGTDPFISPVPLEALAHYELIYSSNITVTLPNVGAVPAVKIFEYAK